MMHQPHPRRRAIYPTRGRLTVALWLWTGCGAYLVLFGPAFSPIMWAVAAIAVGTCLALAFILLWRDPPESPAWIILRLAPIILNFCLVPLLLEEVRSAF